MKNYTWKDWLFFSWVVLLVAFALTTIVFGRDSTWKWLGENSSNIASWVQAIGSIATIYFSLKVSRSQMDSQRILHEEQFVAARKSELAKEKKDLISKKLRGYRSLFRKILAVQARLDYMNHVLSLDDALDANSLINNSKFISETLAIDAIVFDIGDEEVLDSIDKIRSNLMAIEDMLNEAIDRNLVADIDRPGLATHFVKYADELSRVKVIGENRVASVISADQLTKWKNDEKELSDLLEFDLNS